MEVGKINKANIFLFTPLAAWGQRESVAQTFIPLRLTNRAVRMPRSKHQDMLLRPGSFFGSSRALLLALWLFSHYWKSSVGLGSKLELIFWTCSFVAFPLLRLRRLLLLASAIFPLSYNPHGESISGREGKESN